MKSRMLRALTVGAALLIPAGGLTLLGAGVAGAVTKTIQPSFQFLSSGTPVSKITCHVTPAKKVKFPAAGGKNTASQDWAFGTTTCRTTSTPAKKADLTIPLTGMSWGGPTTNTYKYLKTKVVISATTTGVDCKITLNVTVTLNFNGTKWVSAAIGTKGHATVTPAAPSCAHIRSLVTTVNSTFIATITP